MGRFYGFFKASGLRVPVSIAPFTAAIKSNGYSLLAAR